MNNLYKCLLFFFLFSFIFFAFIKPVYAQSSDVVLEFYFAQDCSHCEEKGPIIGQIEDYFKENISVKRLSIEISENKNIFFKYGFTSTPGVVVKNESVGNFTIFSYELITFENLKNSITYHLEGNYSKEPIKPDNKSFCIGTPFGDLCLDTGKWSLPVLTIVLGAIDSVNPCSFFVLLFLLSLLLHTKSRKRMILIGSIFIFFSGFIYLLLMVAMLFFFLAVEQQMIIAIIAGIVALIFGALNIKDFFYFKKGPSAGISEEKKSKLFKQMSKIIRMKSIVPVVIATIILAISANAVELLCSFNLPFVYTGILTSYSLDSFSYFLYLLLYNIVYIVPLLVLVLVVVYTLGRWKLSELQGRKLKLFSGIMMSSLGFLLIFYKGFLINIFAVLLILALSFFLTLIISFFWKKYFP